MDIAIFRLRRLNITMYLEKRSVPLLHRSYTNFSIVKENILALRPDITPSVASGGGGTFDTRKDFRFVFVMSETLLSIIQAIAAS